jgi:hypothetical protein
MSKKKRRVQMQKPKAESLYRLIPSARRIMARGRELIAAGMDSRQATIQAVLEELPHLATRLVDSSAVKLMDTDLF